MRRAVALLMVAALAAVGLGLALTASRGGEPAPPGPDRRVRAEAARCDLTAAPAGSDRAPGTAERPLRTVARLLERLRPGQTGCLRGGRYVQSRQLDVPHGGEPEAPITLRSHPGERATIAGAMLVVPVAASDVVLSGLDIDGGDHDEVTIWIQADRVVLQDSAITNRRRALSCVLIGGDLPPGDHADGVVVRNNRIVGCGKRGSTHDHGVYAADARDSRIEGNLIADVAAYGVQLYPRAQRVQVTQNTIVDTFAGVIFGGSRSTASRDNTVARNVIAGVRDEYLAVSWWDGPEGSGNVLERNCLRGARGEAVWGSGFVARDNVLADPAFVDPGRGDFRVGPGSRCLAVIGSPPAPGAPASVVAAR
jgi:hypothetical protein